jgi:hypothetical protein
VRTAIFPESGLKVASLLTKKKQTKTEVTGLSLRHSRQPVSLFANKKSFLENSVEHFSNFENICTQTNFFLGQ